MNDDNSVMYNVPRVTHVIKKIAQKFVVLNRYPTADEMDQEFSMMKLSEKERPIVWQETCRTMWYIVFFKGNRTMAEKIMGFSPDQECQRILRQRKG